MRHELHAEACRSVAVQRRGKEIEATLCSASLDIYSSGVVPRARRANERRDFAGEELRCGPRRIAGPLPQCNRGARAEVTRVQRRRVSHGARQRAGKIALPGSLRIIIYILARYSIRK